MTPNLRERIQQRMSLRDRIAARVGGGNEQAAIPEDGSGFTGEAMKGAGRATANIAAGAAAGGPSVIQYLGEAVTGANALPMQILGGAANMLGMPTLGDAYQRSAEAVASKGIDISRAVGRGVANTPIMAAGGMTPPMMAQAPRALAGSKTLAPSDRAAADLSQMNNGTNFLPQTSAGWGSLTGEQLPALGLGFGAGLVGGPTVGVAVTGAAAGAQEYEATLAQLMQEFPGKSADFYEGEAARRAIQSAAVESVTERLPMGEILEGRLAKMFMGKAMNQWPRWARVLMGQTAKAGTSMLAEGTEEVTSEGAGAVGDRLAGDPNAFQNLPRRMATAGLIGGAMGAGLGGLTPGGFGRPVQADPTTPPTDRMGRRGPTQERTPESDNTARSSSPAASNGADAVSGTRAQQGSSPYAQSRQDTTALDEAAAQAEARLNEQFNRAAPVGTPSPADQSASSQTEQGTGADPTASVLRDLGIEPADFAARVEQARVDQYRSNPQQAYLDGKITREQLVAFLDERVANNPGEQLRRQAEARATGPQPEMRRVDRNPRAAVTLNPNAQQQDAQQRRVPDRLDIEGKARKITEAVGKGWILDRRFGLMDTRQQEDMIRAGERLDPIWGETIRPEADPATMERLGIARPQQTQAAPTQQAPQGRAESLADLLGMDSEADAQRYANTLSPSERERLGLPQRAPEVQRQDASSKSPAAGTSAASTPVSRQASPTTAVQLPRATSSKTSEASLPVQSPSPQSTREPWQMTRGEWVGGGTVGRIRFGDVDREFVESPQFDTPEEAKAWASSRGIANPQIQSSGKRGGPKLYKASGSTSVHRDAVESAHAAGKPVPPEVLAEYGIRPNPSASPNSSNPPVKPDSSPQPQGDAAATTNQEPTNGEEEAPQAEVLTDGAPAPAPAPAPKPAPAPAPKPAPAPSGSRLSPEKQAELERLKAEFKKKLRGDQLNMGVDPELFSLGVRMAALYLEDQALKFSDFARKLIDDIGEEIRPYLKSLYMGASAYPGIDSSGLDNPGTVSMFDLESIQKEQTDGTGTAEEAPAVPPKPVEVTPEPEPAPVEDPAPTESLSGLPDSYSPAKTYKRMTPRKGTDARTNLEQELERYKERRKVLWDDSERAAEDLSRFERTSTLKKNTKEYKQKHGDLLRKQTAAREAWREFMEKESKDSLRRSNKGAPSIGDMMVVLNLEDAADSADPLVAVPARLRLAAEWSYGTDSSRWNNRGVDDYNAARKWFDGYVADRMKAVEPTDGPGILSKDQESASVREAAKEAAQSLVEGSAPKDINTMMLGYLERERRTIFATHVSNAIDQIRNSFSNRNADLWNSVNKAGQDIGSPNRTTLSIVELSDRLKRAQAIRDDADGATASLVAEGVGEIVESINATPARRVGPSLEKMDTPLLARLHKWANVNLTSFKNEVQAVLLKRAGTYAKIKEMVEEQASMPFIRPESTRRKNRGPLVLTGEMLLGKTGVEKTPEAGDSPLEILKSVAALEREAAAVGLSKKDAKALPARHINLLTLEGDNVVVRTKDATYKFVADRFGIDPGEFESGQVFLIDWRSIDRLDARRKELSKMKGKALDDLAESMEVLGKSADRMILNIMQKESGLYPAFRQDFDTSALDANAPEVGERLASAYPEDWNGPVLKLDAEANTPSGDVIQKLEKIIDKLRVRMEERAKSKGYRLYSTIIPIMHPLDIIDTSAWVAAHALRATIKGGRALTAFIDAKLTERFPGVQYDKRAVRKTVAAYLKNATTEQEIYDAWKTANSRESKHRIAAVAGESPDPKAVKEAAATGAAERPDVAAKIIDAVKRGLRQGRAEGLRTASDAIKPLIRQARDAAKRARQVADIEARGASEKATNAAKDQAATEKGIRAEAVRLVQETPIAGRRKYLAAVANAANMRDLAKILRRLRGDLAKETGRHFALRAERLEDSFKKLDEKRLNPARKLLRDIRQMYAELKDKDTGVDQREELADSIRDSFETLNSIIHEQRAADKVFMQGRAIVLAEHRDKMMEAVQKQAELPKPENSKDDREPTWLRQKIRKYADFRTLMQILDRVWDETGIFSRARRAMESRRTAELAKNHEFIDKAEKIVQANGYKSWSDFMARSEGAMGDSGAEWVKIDLGAVDRLTVGQAMALYAQDIETKELMHAGQPWRLNRSGDSFVIDDYKLAELESKLTAGQKRIARQINQLRSEMQFDRADAVYKRITGNHMTKVDGHYPRKRILDKSGSEDTIDIAKLSMGEWAVQSLENSGFTIKRVQDRKTPLLLEDFGSTQVRSFQGTEMMIQRAEMVKYLKATLFNPAISDAIAQRYGGAMMKRITQVVAEYSGNSAPESDKFIRKVAAGTARSMTQVNPGTWLRNLSTVFRLPLAMIDGKMVGAGAVAAAIPKALLNWRSTLKILMQHSPDLRHRWSHAGAAISMMPTGATTDVDSHFADATKATVRQVLHAARAWSSPRTSGGRLRQVGKGWGQILDSIKVGNAFDAFAAVVAYHIARPKASESLSPGAADKWAARKAADAFMQTANTNDLLNANEWQTDAKRNTGAALILTFTSDIAKMQNLLFLANKRGGKARTLAAGAVAASLVWSVAVRYALASLLGDDDEKKDQEAINTVREELVSLIPGGTNLWNPLLDTMTRGGRTRLSVLDTPLTSIVRHGEALVNEMRKEDGDPLEMAYRASRVFLDPVGNPLAPISGMARRAFKNYAE